MDIETHCVSPAGDPTYSKFTRFLRWAGTGILFLAIADFLIKGIADLLPQYRYFSAAGLSMLLALCGLTCGYRWRDTVGARWFFALAVACVPAQYTQISAALIDHLQAGNAPAPAWWHNQPLPMAWAVTDLVLSFLLLTPITVIAFRTLARTHATRLTVLLASGCIALLLPFRSAAIVQTLLFGSYACLSFHDRRYFGADLSLRTGEGGTARALVWVPWLLLFGRSLFYPLSWWVLAGLTFMLSLICLFDAPRFWKHKVWKTFACNTGLVLAAAAWWCVTNGVLERQWLPVSAVLSLRSLPYAGLLFGLAPYFPAQASTMRKTGSWLVGITIMTNLLDTSDAVQATAALLSGVILSALGIRYQERVPIVLGSVCGLCGLLHYVSAMLSWYTASPWLALALSGIALLLMASYLDAHGRSAWMRSQQAWQAFKAWN